MSTPLYLGALKEAEVRHQQITEVLEEKCPVPASLYPVRSSAIVMDLVSSRSKQVKGIHIARKY